MAETSISTKLICLHIISLLLSHDLHVSLVDKLD